MSSERVVLSLHRRTDAIDWAGQAEIAYQPIVSMTSLRTHGFEALARLPVECPYDSVHALMDAASADGSLIPAERALMARSITKFSHFSGSGAARLFCNVDNRVFDDPRCEPSHLVAIAVKSGLEPGNLCIELSERKPPESMDALRRLVDVFLRYNVRIAIDDFGRGFSGLDMLMQVNPHYVKIDRAFVDGVSESPRQQAIIHKIAGLAHSLGFVVVAEGIETEADFRTARDLGCDLAQGFLIARPSTSLPELKLSYVGTASACTRNGVVPAQIAELIARVEPLRLTDPLAKAIAKFRNREVIGLLPVVDEHDHVHGAIYEADISYYLFGDFGPALLANKGLDQGVHKVLRRCPISEATVPLETLVESYVVAARNEGLVLTLDGRYAGVLGNHEILRLAAARDVAAARDQNPLTFLPGNNSINRHLQELISSSDGRSLVYFDFDNFKAFNDRYGFAVGDRALLMFADLMLKYRYSHDVFAGHIGGDDFFMSIPGDPIDAQSVVVSLAEKFRNDVESLYLLDDRAQGGIWAKDRFGGDCFFPLLRASAALLPLPAARAHLDASSLVSALSDGKGRAKSSEGGLEIVGVPLTGMHAQLDRVARLASIA